VINLLLELLGGFLTERGWYGAIRSVDTLFQQLEFRVFCAFACSFVVVLIFGNRVIRWLALKKIGDAPEFNHAQLNEMMRSKANTPTMGGILIAAAVLVSTLLFGELTNDYVVMGLIVALWHAIVGGFDDWLKLTAASRGEGSRQGLRSWEKLVFQLGLGVVIGYFAYQVGAQGVEAAAEQSQRMAHVLNLPFQRTYVPPERFANPELIYLTPIVYVTIMTLFIAGMSNAVNLTDGMDGLAAGIAAIVGVGLIALCVLVGSDEWARGELVPYVPGSGELAVLASALAGAVGGFLWFNCSPASVFMGDTGSLLIGGVIGYIAVIVRMEYVVIIMTGVYLWEILSVVIQVGYFKSTGGKRVFRCAPYHHHLHMGGWPEQRVVARFWIVTVILTAVALASLKLR
jgi:phospho-N-acetylmuramoyl-pentapeptide-transferase